MAAAALAGSGSRADFLILSVPDDAIAPTAALLAGRISCRFAFHLSGALPAGVLAPLAAGGTALGSLHPLRAFTGHAGEDWRGAFVAVEGDPAAEAEGEAIAKALDATPHRLREESKPLYHAAATLAAGGNVALLSVAARALVQAGIPEEAGRPALALLAASAVAPLVEGGFEETLTGPVARRDAGTVRANLSAIGDRAELRKLYALLGLETLRRTPGRGREEEIQGLLEGTGSLP